MEHKEGALPGATGKLNSTETVAPSPHGVKASDRGELAWQRFVRDMRAWLRMLRELKGDRR